MPRNNWRDALNAPRASATEEVAKTARKPRATPTAEEIKTEPVHPPAAMPHGKYHRFPPAYCLDIVTKKEITICCLCNARDPTDRYVVILQGKIAGDSAAVESAYDKLRTFTEKLK